MKTILIALDPSIFRYGLKQIIATMPIPTQVVPTDNLAAAITLLETKCFDLLITDRHPAELATIREKCPALRVLIYTAAEEKTFAIDYLLAGADGYLSQRATKEEMENAVRTVLNGEKYMSGEIRQEMLTEIGQYRKADRKGMEIFY